MRAFAYVIALFSSLLLLDPKIGLWRGLLWIPKLLMAALAPITAVLGGVSIISGILRRDKWTIAAGVWGTAVTLLHIRQVTAPRDDAFARAFGPDWENHIPPDLRRQLTPTRWQIPGRDPGPGSIQCDVIYGANIDTQAELPADILLPPEGVPHTGLALLFVHGGAWLYGQKNIQKYPLFNILSQQGHVIMDINYTLAPETSIMGMVSDVQQAVIWLKQHAGKYGIRPDRIVMTGQSAGGHLSLLTAYSARDPAMKALNPHGDVSVRGVISLYGPTDMITMYEQMEARFGPYANKRVSLELQNLLESRGYKGKALVEGLPGFMGGTPAELPEIYRLVSPMYYAGPHCPPTLLVHGAHDFLVDYHYSEQLYNALRLAGVPAVFVTMPGCDHTFEAVFPRISPSAQTAAYYIERFLALMVSYL
ncbi:MAG TPA: alpha/beta hydrolase [Anaerolineae bacterium]|nr:alpha/beta hydrolase [Anaerolineae bacterium]HIP72027.1 alpha/beta hydrolase [Anaerolineae bacterium]